MPSRYTATDARAYEHLMGRWSTRLAKKLIAFGGLETRDRVLDVGCGTGSMALALAARSEPVQIVGIDTAEPYIAFAATRSRSKSRMRSAGSFLRDRRLRSRSLRWRLRRCWAGRVPPVRRREPFCRGDMRSFRKSAGSPGAAIPSTSKTLCG